MAMLCMYTSFANNFCQAVQISSDRLMLPIVIQLGGFLVIQTIQL